MAPKKPSKTEQEKTADAKKTDQAVKTPQELVPVVSQRPSSTPENIMTTRDLDIARSGVPENKDFVDHQLPPPEGKVVFAPEPDATGNLPKAFEDAVEGDGSGYTTVMLNQDVIINGVTFRKGRANVPIASFGVWKHAVDNTPAEVAETDDPFSQGRKEEKK